MIKETVKNVADNSTLIVTRINTMMANTENCANITTLSLIKIIQGNLNYSENSASYLEIRGKIENELNTIKITFPDIESSAFIDKDFNAFILNNSLANNLNKAFESGIFKEVDNSSTQNKWFLMQKREFLVTDINSPVLTLAKKVIDPRNGKKLGILVLNIKESTISDIYASVGPENITSYFIVDGQGKIVSSQKKDDVLKSLTNTKLRQLILGRGNFSEIKDIDGKNTLITSTSLEYFDWRLVSVIPIQKLTDDVNKNTIVVVLLGIMCMILALLAATVLSRVIAKPLVKLTKKMDEIKDGNLDVVCNVNSKDEIGRLALGFNIMVERIKELLNKSTQEQKKLREYELALIQAQIKPHFLYNSLELIYTLCGMAGAKEAQIATKSLADFYRIALSKGKEIISLEEEIKNVNDYLNIQRYRYYDVFDYEIKVQDEIKRSKILKLTLQPLVENSIYHALKTKGSFGRILIEGYMEDDNVIIKVFDDGVGISEEKIKEIFDYQHPETDKGSFGLRSVDERIKLFFGEKYGLKIESVLGEGTIITVVIPFLTGGSGYAEINHC
jgi:two-component system sensor histidine kinase YesM